MQIKHIMTSTLTAGLSLLFSFNVFAQSSAPDSLLVLPGIWKADVTSLNIKDQTSHKMGKQLTCVKESITSEQALISPFFEKYITAGCSFAPVRNMSVYSAVKTKEKYYSSEITCGAMKGRASIVVIDDGTVYANVLMKGEINGVLVGENMKTKLEWEWVGPSCK